jgi:hypothetical protein
MEAGFRPRGGARFPAALTDLTSDGGCIDTKVLLEEGSDGWLQLPTLSDWEARVVWRRGSRAGLAFRKPFHEAVMAMLFGRAEGEGAASRHSSRRVVTFAAPYRRRHRREQILAGVPAPFPIGHNSRTRAFELHDEVVERIGSTAGIRLRARSSHATIIDVSMSGLTVKSPLRPYIGEDVEVELGDVGSLQGMVSWWLDGCFGIEVAPAD